MPNSGHARLRHFPGDNLDSGHPQQSRTQHVTQSIHGLPSLSSNQSDRPLKRKELHDRDSVACEEPSQKKKRASEECSLPPGNEASADGQDVPEICWEEYFGAWPPMSAQNTDLRQSRPNKRSFSSSRSSNYSQQVRDGDAPAPWTRKHEDNMEAAGLFMQAHSTQVVPTDECQQLCDQLLEAEYQLPGDPVYQKERLAELLKRVRCRNEARIVRDITPTVVPSPELLCINGIAGLDTICEALDAEWTQCDTLCGPRPKPDLACGIAATAFTSEEKEMLRLLHTSACPNLFPENMYFPFLTCEVKSSDRSIDEAERQAMHSASIAVRAIVGLFRQVAATEEIHRRILAFSVAHNHKQVVIFAHFAAVDAEKTSFFRRSVYEHTFEGELNSTSPTRAYSIIRAIFDHFVPGHIERIRSALSRMREPLLAPSRTQRAVEEDSQAWSQEQSSSQEGGSFKKPYAPSLMIRQQREQMVAIQKQLAQQTEDSRKQREDHRKQMDKLEEQLALQREDSRERREDLREQKVMMEKQLAQQQQLIERLLSKSTV